MSADCTDCLQIRACENGREENYGVNELPRKASEGSNKKESRLFIVAL